MYLHLGNETVVLLSDVVAILDIETATTEKITREYLKTAETRLQVTSVSEQLPKSVVICNDISGKRVYLSQISSKTLQKRCEVFKSDSY